MSDDNKLKGLMNKVTSNPIYTGKIKPVLDKVFKTPISKKIGLGAVILIVLLLIVRCFAGGGSSSANDEVIQAIKDCRLNYNPNKTMEQTLEDIPYWRIDKWEKWYDDDGAEIVSCWLIPEKGISPLEALIGNAKDKVDYEGFCERLDQLNLQTINNSLKKYNPGMITKLSASDVEKINDAYEDFEYVNEDDIFMPIKSIKVRIDFLYNGKSSRLCDKQKIFSEIKPKGCKSIQTWEYLYQSQVLAFMYHGQTVLGFLE